MRTRTLAQLRTEIRNRGEIDSDFVPDSELNRMINAAYADYYGYLVDCNRDLFLSSGTISVSSGTQTYALPTDCWKIVGVEVLEGSDYYTLTAFNFSERNRCKDGSDKLATRYRAMADNLWLEPKPQWSGTIKIWYIPEPTELSADGDTVRSYAGWEECVVLHALIQYKVKAEEDPRDLRAALDAEKMKVCRLVERNEADPDQVRDVYAESGYNLTRYGITPRLPGVP